MPRAVGAAAPPERFPGRLHALLEAAEAQLNAPEEKQPPVFASACEAGHWRAQEKTRSNGTIYKRWCSPTGKTYRTLKEAINEVFVSA